MREKPAFAPHTAEQDDRRISMSVGEQPATVAMGPPQAAQLVENWLWQRHQPLLVALADDAQHPVGADFRRGGLADAQATRIHDGEATSCGSDYG